MSQSMSECLPVSVLSAFPPDEKELCPSKRSPSCRGRVRHTSGDISSLKAGRIQAIPAAFRGADCKQMQ